ncbi:MAG TPA: YbhB/YbcL family Raf kinase inhibitor-like protein [Micromonosporaceae bacterium]
MHERLRKVARAGTAVVLAGLAALVIAGCTGGGEPSPSTVPPAPSATTATGIPAPSSPSSRAPMTVASPAFSDGARIPDRYSCRGENSSPPLTWTGVPAGAAALALVMDDPDAVGGRYLHWIVSDIPAGTSGTVAGDEPAGGQVSANSSGEPAYLGPCPPPGSGVHHYRFTVYALTRRLSLSPSTPAERAVELIAGSAIGQGRLVGTYTG